MTPAMKGYDHWVSAVLEHSQAPVSTGHRSKDQVTLAPDHK